MGRKPSLSTAVIRQIIQLASNYKLSCRQIAKVLRKHGINTSYMTVYRVLRRHKLVFGSKWAKSQITPTDILQIDKETRYELDFSSLALYTAKHSRKLWLLGTYGYFGIFVDKHTATLKIQLFEGKQETKDSVREFLEYCGIKQLPPNTVKTDSGKALLSLKREFPALLLVKGKGGTEKPYVESVISVIKRLWKKNIDTIMALPPSMRKQFLIQLATLAEYLIKPRRVQCVEVPVKIK